MKFLRNLVKSACPDCLPELDLHGLKVPEALEATRKVVEEGGKVRIIFGKGKGSAGGVGVLREAVCGWLDAHGVPYRRVVDADGGDGSVVLDL